MAALLAHVQLVAALLVGVLQRDAVDLLHVGLQGAALRERLVAQRALVRAHAWKKENVSLFYCGKRRNRAKTFQIFYICFTLFSSMALLAIPAKHELANSFDKKLVYCAV